MQKEDKEKENHRETCFSVLAKHKVKCMRNRCPHWINFEKEQNCILIATSNGPYTLQEIGKIFDLTRMRICQIEKKIYKKIKASCKQS